MGGQHAAMPSPNQKERKKGAGIPAVLSPAAPLSLAALLPAAGIAAVSRGRYSRIIVLSCAVWYCVEAVVQYSRITSSE